MLSVSDALMAEAEWRGALFVIGLKSHRPIGDVGPRIPPIQTRALLSLANGLTRRSHPPTPERINSSNRPS